jgi:hypothetical protein
MVHGRQVGAQGGEQHGGRRSQHQHAHVIGHVGGQLWRLADGVQHRLDVPQQRDQRQRHQRGHGHAGAHHGRDPLGRIGAARVRHQDADAGQRLLEQSCDGEIDARGQAAGRQRVAAQRAEQDGVGDAHAHLRQLRAGQRQGEPQRRGEFLAEARRGVADGWRGGVKFGSERHDAVFFRARRRGRPGQDARAG